MTSLFRNAFRRVIIVSALFLSVFASIGGEAGAEPPYQAAWTQQMGTASDDATTGVSVDGSGNVYVAGYTYGGLDGNANAGGEDAFVVKYSPAGVKQWTRQMGTASDDVATGISVDGTGNAYVVGYTGGGLDGNTNVGFWDLFVVKYDTDGVKQWTRQMGTVDYDVASDISVDGSGNVYVAGYTYGGLDGNTNAGGRDLFVVKYDSAGVKQWTRQLGTGSSDCATGVSVDGTGNVYVAGFTDGGLDGNTNAGADDLFVVKYDSAGVKQWTCQLGSGTYDYAYGVSVDGFGNAYVAGYTYGELDGNAGAGGVDLFVVKYDSDGVKQWTRQTGSAFGDWAEGVSVDGTGNVYVAGWTYGGLDGNVNAGDGDFFVVKYDGTGVKQWTWQMGTNVYDWASGVSADGAGNVYVTGATEGWLGGMAGGRDFFLTRLVPGPYSVITDPADGATLTSSYPGETTTITGTSSAGNGVAFVEVSTDGGATWQTASGTDPWNFDWTLPANGTFNLLSRATDAFSYVETPGAGITVNVNPLSIISFTANPASPQVAGTEVIWTTVATGGSGSYLYKYWLKGPGTGGVYSMVNEWGPSSTLYFVPLAGLEGTHTFKVKVMDLSGGATVQTVRSFNVTYSPIVIQTFGPSPVSPKPNGTLITWDATVTGGSGSYLYKYYRKGPDTGNVYTVARDWDASASWDWTPSPAQVGVSTIKLRVMNSAGGGVVEAVKGFRVQ